MKILITGGAGFIGGHVAAALRQQSGGRHKIIIFDKKPQARHTEASKTHTYIQGDIRDAEAVHEAAVGCNAIIHLAAAVSVEQLNKDPLLAESVNVQGSANVIAAAERSGAKLVAASSAAVYGLSPPTPTPEDAPLSPANPYGASKAAMEKLITSANIHSCILRFFNVYGPGQNPKSRYAAVIPLFITQALAGHPLTIQGSGQQSRDFIYVEDVVTAIRLALSAKSKSIVNIGTGVATSINELAERIITITKSESTTKHVPARRGDPIRSVASTQRAKTLLGFAAQTTITEGLRKTVASFRANEDG
ncbi:NAD-dependent epimerase/dehydratase family protein [Candidatus Woesearchaeota archaeon]|nr:MAG: NAD-dependent epimerase/dehydratase family protein [Candidatus Woesearchaeota archaeon]